MPRNLSLTRDQAEWLVDLLEYCDPKTEGSWRHDLASEIREQFGMSPRNIEAPPTPSPTYLADFKPTNSNQEAIEKMVHEHNLTVDKLTELQLAEALRQAILCGDFIRLVQTDTSFPVHRQSITYIPFRREQELKARIQELESALEFYKAPPTPSTARKPPPNYVH